MATTPLGVLVELGIVCGTSLVNVADFNYRHATVVDILVKF
jgi:hypothetical protein